MYPKNNASPPIIAVGQVILIADGSVVTADASARVKIGTGGWGASAGTLACDSTSGCWTYIPSQAETNAESFIVAVYKASCIGCQVTVVTTASATAGITHVGGVLATALTETSAGYLAAGFKKLFDVATPVLTAASVNQTGDNYAVVAHTDYGNAKLVRSTTPANTLSVDAAHKIPATIAAGDIANDAITAASIATGAFTADAFAANALVAATFATGALAAGVFGANAITNAAVANDVDVNVKTVTAGVFPTTSDVANAAAAATKTLMEAAGAHLALILADTGTDIPASIAALPTAIENADALLIRDVDNVEAAILVSGNKDCLAGAILQLRHSNTGDNAGYLTVYCTTGTEYEQLAIVSSASADAITGVGDIP